MVSAFRLTFGAAPHSPWSSCRHSERQVPTGRRYEAMGERRRAGRQSPASESLSRSTPRDRGLRGIVATLMLAGLLVTGLAGPASADYISQVWTQKASLPAGFT